LNNKKLKAMKKYAGYLLVAILGGFISLGSYALLEKKSDRLQGVPQPPLPVTYASMAGNDAILPDFTTAANMSIHAVVHIKTEYERKNMYYDYFFDLNDFFNNRRSNTPQPLEGSGSGVIISPDGYIVTNNHVVQDASKVTVVLNDKREFDARIIGTDPSTDIAVVKIDEKDLPYIVYGNSDELKIGEWVLAVGNPFNLTSTVTAGIVSAKARNINILGTPDGSAIEAYIQTDAAVNRGNSGGALVNIKGELVGINAAIASGTGYYAGYSFAIPVNIAKKVVADLIEFGKVQRAFLGVSIRDIDSKFAGDNNIKELRGVYISDVVDNGSAKDAGIVKGDVITAIDGIKVNSTSELLEQIGQYRPGDKTKISVLRNGSEKDYMVTLKNKGGTTSVITQEDQDNIAKLGASFAPVSPETCNKLGISGGVQVSKLSDGVLKEAGIKEGYIITEIDNKPVRTAKDIEDALNDKRGGVLIEGIYPNRTRAYYGFGL
jgi:Do/DeqQ family serine protease